MEKKERRVQNRTKCGLKKERERKKESKEKRSKTCPLGRGGRMVEGGSKNHS